MLAKRFHVWVGGVEVSVLGKKSLIYKYPGIYGKRFRNVKLMNACFRINLLLCVSVWIRIG